MDRNRSRDESRRWERPDEYESSAEKYNAIVRKLRGKLGEIKRKFSEQYECDSLLEFFTSTEQDLWKEAVSICSDNFGEIKKEFFDILIFCCMDNKAEIQNFIEYLRVLAEPETLNITFYDQHWKADLMKDNSDLFLFKKQDSCSLMSVSSGFVFLSKEFCNSVWPKLSSTDFFRDALYNKSMKYLYPVLPQNVKSADFKIPMGLGQLKKIQYYKKDETLRDILRKVLTTIIQKTKVLKEEHFTFQCRHIYDRVLHDTDDLNHVNKNGKWTQCLHMTESSSNAGKESHDQVFTRQPSVFLDHEVPSAGTGRGGNFERHARNVVEENVQKKPNLSVASIDIDSLDFTNNDIPYSSQLSCSSNFDSRNTRVSECEMSSQSSDSSFLGQKDGPIKVDTIKIPAAIENDGRPTSPEKRNLLKGGMGHTCIQQPLDYPFHIPKDVKNSEPESQKPFQINLFITNAGNVQIGDKTKIDNSIPVEKQDLPSEDTNTQSQNNFSGSKLEDDNSNVTRDCGSSRHNVSPKPKLDECNLYSLKLKEVQKDNMECSQNPSNETKIATLTPRLSDLETWSLNENDDLDFSITHEKEINRGSDENENKGGLTTHQKTIDNTDMFSRENKQQNSGKSINSSKRTNSGSVVEKKQNGPNGKMLEQNNIQVSSGKKIGFWNMNEKRKPLEQSHRKPTVGLARPICQNNVAAVMVRPERSYSNNGCNGTAAVHNDDDEDDDEDDDDNDILNDLLSPTDDDTNVKRVSFADETAVKDIN